MARDPLAVLWRLRDASVADASATLATARAGALRAAERLDAHQAGMCLEQSRAGGTDGLAFAAWLPHARQQAQHLRAAILTEDALCQRLLQALTERRTEAEAVAKALQRRRAEVGLIVARREQAVMDEAASLRGRRHGF